MAWNPKDLKLWHEMLMDYKILHPRAPNAELAAHFEVSEQMISMVTNTDMFKAQLADRRDRMALQVEGTAIGRLQNKVAALAEKSLDRLMEAVTLPDTPLDGVRDSCDMALKSLGFGQSGGRQAAPAVSVSVVVVDKEVLANARLRMRGGSPLMLEQDASASPSAA